MKVAYSKVKMECVVCGRSRKLIDNMFCSPKCEKRYHKTEKHQAYVSKRWHKRHFLNGHNICGICEEPILDYDQANIDHVVPLSKGGSDTLDNMQISHITCNSKKGSSL